MKYERAAAIGALLLGLAACQGPSNSPGLYGPAAAPQALSSRMAPGGDTCGGSGGVKVRPCPVTLTKKRQTVKVMVSGPGVTDSAVKTNSKNHVHGGRRGEVCEVSPFSSNPLEWAISAGTMCGNGSLAFYGYNSSGGTVGIGRLKVINKDC